MSKFNSKTTKTIFLTLITIFVIFLSEFIYAVKNQPVYFQHISLLYHLKQTKIKAHFNQPQQSFSHFIKAAEIKLNLPTEEKIQDNTQELLLSLQLPNNQSEYSGIFKNLDFKTLSPYNSSITKWSKVFYFLGLKISGQEKKELAIPFFQTAVNLAPSWGHFHVELANLYLILNQKQQAQKILHSCLQYKFPKKDCQEYLDQNINQNISETVGFREQKITKEI